MNHKRIDLRVDFAFKAVFGTPGSERILVAFLEPVYSLINMLGCMQKQEMSVCLIQVISAVKNSRSFVRN
ncbi:hypothetical protein [Bacillus cereus group sp. IBL03679]|uniref:hypothetical protein n=1 Tax=Bacillus cereus group sp. IBL03679 TaxID=3240095 RepID=UPI003D2F8A5F